MPTMPDEPRPASSVVVTPLKSPLAAPACSTEQRMVCERCGGASVYRMHAVWRCADCGFKTDCCGW
jgi:ribosomal protein L37AE/L43A